ncbi:MAG: 6-phospho-3-hexuloisomerase [Candidatus Ratteibacteria bacterium]|jgi:6-phospho-3-hexuloisomerase
MDFDKNRKIALRELSESLSNINEKEAGEFLDRLLKSRRIFVAGAGRSMLMLQAFAQRLRHLGKESYVVAETVTPAIGKGDLLVVASGSGKTGGVINILKLAGKHKADIVFITASSSPSPEKTVSLIVTIPGVFSSRQLMASLFEQTLLLFCDNICLALKGRLKVSETQMRKNHANLE